MRLKTKFFSFKYFKVCKYCILNAFIEYSGRILVSIGFEKIGITEIRACIDNLSSVGIRDLELSEDFSDSLENYSDLLSDKPKNSAVSRLPDFQFP